MITGSITCRDLLAEAEGRLARAGVEEARLDAELLLAELLGLSRTMLRMRQAETLAADGRGRYEALLARRERREPLAYIVGRQEFMGLPFVVDRRVLIPRWDTEPLVERAVVLLREAPDRPQVADIGVGSGAIAVSVAHLVPRALVLGTDCDADALALAADNCRANNVAERVELFPGELAEPLLAAGWAGRLAAVLSNPPYIPTEVLAGLQPEVLQEPRLALDGGPDGLDVIRRLAPMAAALLAPGGFALLECGSDQAAAVAELLTGAGLTGPETVLDLAGRDRGVLAWKPAR